MDNVLPTSTTDYDSAVRWIYDRIDYERIRPRQSSTHFRLERIERLLSLIDSPHLRIPAIHIAGTKGKGSTATMVDSILTASGIRSGLYTSPHVHNFEERMRVQGKLPSPSELTSLVAELQNRLNNADPAIVEDEPTYFEVATMLSWMYFDRNNVEIAVLETGLGGRLDCTNVCRPLLTIITAIGLDHTHILGDTIEKIAAEKAGIIKHSVPVLTWPVRSGALSVISDTAAKNDSELLVGGQDIRVLSRSVQPRGQRFSIATPWREHLDLFLPLAGEHQSRNAALAIAAADLLSKSDTRITAKTIADGIAGVSWPLRFEVFPSSPTVVLDAAHNVDATAAFVATLNESMPRSKQKRVLIFASSKDKDAQGMLNCLLPEFDAVVLTEFLTNPRATDVHELTAMCSAANIDVSTAATPQEASKAATTSAGSDGLVCGTGSIFLAAELREILRR